MNQPHFNVPLNLPHAATLAARIVYHLERIQKHRGLDLAAALLPARRLQDLLDPYLLDEAPPEKENAVPLVENAAGLAREIVEHVESCRAGDDRLGQAVRNLFECLEKGAEGARISLRAGEDPRSALRP
ncbi:MAG TPA: hypothetical protein VEK08_26495 [Planctomycetota bacterium]|nr:hypothetical protein [Planctomycetota bacterium]